MSSAKESPEIIQFVPFTSFVHPSFWHMLTEMKINVDKLSEAKREIYGRFTFRSDIAAVFEVDGTSFNKSPEDEISYQNITGKLLNKNTIEDYKAIDKAALLNTVGEELWTKTKNKEWITNPTKLLHFIILSFADLKKFHYYYWFAFPAPSQPTIYMKEASKTISQLWNSKQLKDFSEVLKSIDKDQRPFFVIVNDNEGIEIKTIAEIIEDETIVLEENLYFCFVDSSNDLNPGWSLRLFLAALLEHSSSLLGRDLRVIGVRCSAKGSMESSRVFFLNIPQDAKASEDAGWVGWERNDKGNFGPRLANMSASMDPVKLAETSSDLNIRLMKWRLVPDLDLDIMKSTKCLLLGAGTLGCHVARNLLAWGFRHITFVDYGKVSYSNPTRQVLFTHQDCLDGGKKKAVAAADNLKLILPSVKTTGLTLHIPMPGHPIGEALKKETIEDIEKLSEAIDAHDAVFLLLDTREARWLPTLLAASKGKIVINAALGFDSYLVMRHGSASSSPGGGDVGIMSRNVPGDQLGCYFCNDVTAPGNSLRDRTLDQQCTVTRPGVAAIAGALAVELLTGLLQHPLRSNAPALYNSTEDSPPSEGALGSVPHSIRGFLHSFQTLTPTCAKFRQCIACSHIVLDKYRTEGIQFLLNVFNSGNYLEEVTGLADLKLATDMADILTLSDEDDDEELELQELSA